MIKNINRPTPAIWGQIASAIIALNVFLEGQQIEADWFTYAKMGIGCLAVVLIVFTGKK